MPLCNSHHFPGVGLTRTAFADSMFKEKSASKDLAKRGSSTCFRGKLGFLVARTLPGKGDGLKA